MNEPTCVPRRNSNQAIGVSIILFSFFLSFFQIKHCDDLGIPADKSSTLFLFIGVFAAVGRLSAGCLCNMKRVNSLFLYQAAVFVMGASTMLFLQAKTYAPLAAVVVVFSLADGLMVSTCIIVLFRSVQVSQRAPSLGFSMMAGGIFIVCSPPLSGESVYFLDVTLRERMGVPRRRYFVTVYRLRVKWSVRKSNRNGKGERAWDRGRRKSRSKIRQTSPK